MKWECNKEDELLQNMLKRDQSRFSETGNRNRLKKQEGKRPNQIPYTISMGANLRFKANSEPKTYLPVISYIPTP